LPQFALQLVDGACSSILKARYLPLNIPAGFESDLLFLDSHNAEDRNWCDA